MNPNEILLLNPRRKKRATKRRAKRKPATRKRTTTRRKTPARRIRRRPALRAKGRVSMPKRRRRRAAPRRNPSRRKAITRRARGALTGLNFRSAMKNIPLGVIGMFVTKWAAKRGTPDALEDDRTTWDGMTYLKGGLGAAGAGYLANMVKPGTGQKVMEGGLMLLLYKAAQNHLVPRNDFLMNQLGQTSQQYVPGDVEVNNAGEPFILGQDGSTWVPMDEGGELAGMGEDYEYAMMGQDNLETPGRLGFGDVLETPGRLGFGQPATSEAYARSLFSR